MPAHTNSPQPASEWTLTPVDPAKNERFQSQLVDKHEAYYGHTALRIAVTGREYFDSRPELEHVTLVHASPIDQYTSHGMQLIVGLSRQGHDLRHGSVESLARIGQLIIVDGQLPAPHEILETPGLERAKDRLATTHNTRFADGLSYIGLARAAMETTSSFTLGFANPFTGYRIETEVTLAPVKEQLGFPPRLPPPPLRSGGI